MEDLPEIVLRQLRFLECVPDCYLVLDGRNRVLWANRHPDESDGDSDRGSPAGRDVREVLAPMVFEQQDLVAVLAETRTNRSVGRLTGVRFADGKDRERLWDIAVVSNPEIWADAVLMRIADIGEQTNRYSQRLENFRRFTEDVLCSLKSGLAVVDLNGKILVVNLSAAKALQTSRETLLGSHLSAILGELVASEVLGGGYEADSGPYDTRIKLAGDKEVALGFSLAPLYDRESRRTGTIIHFKDVTEIERLKRQMVHQEKMAAIGSLAGGVAHEFNNLIGGMMGYAQLAAATNQSKDVEKCIEVVLDSSRRAREIVCSLLTFASRPDGLLERMQLVDIVEQTIVLLERSIAKQGVEIRRQYEFPGFLDAEVSRLQLLVHHLLVNARDAMPDGGVLTVRIESDEKRVLFSVSDTGCGIEDENLPKLFEPFYTTKGALGSGSIPGLGLGLSVSYGIVQSMNGRITAESRIGEGSTFCVDLPVTTAVAVADPERPSSFAATSAPPSASQEGIRRRVLVVEQDRKIRDALSEALRQKRCVVTSVEDWEATAEMAGIENFDVVFHRSEGEKSKAGMRGRRAIEIANPGAQLVRCVSGGSDHEDVIGQLVLRIPHDNDDLSRILKELDSFSIEQSPDELQGEVERL